MTNNILNYIRKFKTDYMENGEYIEEDKMEVLNFFFRILRQFRFFPQLGQKYTINDILVVLLLIAPIVLCDCISNIILQLTNSEKFLLPDLIDDSAVLTAIIIAYISVGIILFKQQDFLNFAKLLGDFREFRKPIDFDRANKLANILAIIGCGYTSIGSAVFMIMSYSARGSCLKENEVLNLQRVCGMVAPSALPSMFNESPYYWITFLTSGVAPALGSHITTLLFSFLFGSVQMITSRMRQLRKEIEYAFKISDNNLHKKCIKHCVRYHIFIIELVDNLNNCISALCLFQSTYFCVALAGACLQVLVNPEIKHIMLGFIWIYFSILSCFGAQILLDETELIPMYIYDTDWFDYDIDTQKSVLLIIQKGNQGLYIDTKLYGPMGRQIFTMIMKNAYTVVTLFHDQIG